MTRLLLSIVLVLMCGYGAYEAWPLLEGPSLALISPVNGAPSLDGLVRVSGQALRIATLTLNGAPLVRDTRGAFSTMLTLPRGASIITLAATDQFGRQVTLTRTVYISE